MPEVLTKYPQSLIMELKSAGGKCGEGLSPRILKSCPTESFCVLPAGEICVYDFKDVSSMTQIKLTEWSGAVTGIPAMLSHYNFIILILVFGLGLVLGLSLTKKNRS